ncbi:TPA: phage minor capsid protein [Streptococcus agalactiae]|uniref:Capsid protein n=3 Tax=Streptococcus agalactiae TaxID=1311 RepID=A0A0H1HIT0_STRAG|nr:phage minor capsid protein [Streptococcus agalactiae]EPT38502.1 capsid protein [Streptococcus agalactiae FSL S3-603]EPT90720.1 capsid protein [Streptococcus agalactiae BSU178]KLJ84253.1 capsid protein [Streptococcus agalactiae]KLL30082.1 capsid protein [Streptococcus agalactiae]KLL45481.1 capsid protein [Streptococcus agalactiae]
MTERKNKKPTLNDQHFSDEMKKVSDIYAQMQIELFDNMIRRLKIRGEQDLVDNPWVWQLEKLNDMHMLNEENLDIIAKRTGIAKQVLRDVIENEGLKVFEDTHEQLKEDLANANRPYQSNDEMIRNIVTESLGAYVNQAWDELNLINSTLPKSIQKVYKAIIEQSVAEVVSGNKTADRALHDTIIKWQDKNFTGFTDAGGREWRADSYARVIIKSITYRVFNEMRTRAAEDIGIDTYYYSMKSTARAMCAPLQHRIVTKSLARYENGIHILSLLDYGYGTAGGCLGAHCGHYLTPFIVGVNDLPELPDYLKDLTPEQAEENARIEAKQRAIERNIRRHKERLHYATTMNDADLIQLERLNVRKYQQKAKALVDNYDFLHRDYQREKIYT